ncbi:arginase [Kaistia granuli]|uniref:arginase n=1 Tax=Kaistia granuli TaxID=363259 RepID=UPI000477C80E|nr:arginase [Kaistia granuli]
MQCKIIKVPVHEGTGREGCARGAEALEAAGLAQALASLGHQVLDGGVVRPGPLPAIAHANPAVRKLAELSAWTAAIAAAAHAASETGFPVFIGGDHSVAAGTLTGLSRRAAESGRPLFVLWLDAHPDFHTLDTTESGNLHGVPLAYACGLPGFEGYFPPLATPVDPARICALGIRSVDPAEARALGASGVTIHDMSEIDRRGMAVLLEAFLDRVRAADGLLHVSFDVDFLEPAIAPAVGTPVPGGATYREAHLVMELLFESGLVTSLDLVELNPDLDVDGRTASLVVDLAASLFGRRILPLSLKAG